MTADAFTYGEMGDGKPRAEPSGAITDWPYPIDKAVIAASFDVEMEPVSKARARWTRKGRVYTPGKTVHYEKSLRLLLGGVMDGNAPDSESQFGIRCIFQRLTRQRIDCDNLLKAVCDAATGTVWKDDSQVQEVMARVILGALRQRVAVAIYRLPKVLPHYAKVCPTCQREFAFHRKSTQQYCSRKCLSKGRRTEKNCERCDQRFSVPNSVLRLHPARFCSRRCNLAAANEQKNLGREAYRWVCVDCGGPVSRREYKRCGRCSTKARSTKEPKGVYWELIRPVDEIAS